MGRVFAVLVVVVGLIFATLSIEATAGSSSATVTLSSFKIAMNKTTFKTGKVTFKISNRGGSHAFCVKGKGINKCSKTIGSGKKTTLSVTLKKGSFTVYCPVGGHSSAGMKGKIKVS